MAKMKSKERCTHVNLTVVLVVGFLFPGLGLSQDRPPLVDQMGWADTLLVNGKIYKGAKLTGLIKGRCDKCFHDFEQNLAPAGEIVKCPKCQNEGMGE